MDELKRKEEVDKWAVEYQTSIFNNVSKYTELAKEIIAPLNIDNRAFVTEQLLMALLLQNETHKLVARF